MLATGLVLGVASPATATVLVGGSVAIGNPDLRVAADGEYQPCVVGAFLASCIVEGDVELRIAVQPGRS